MTSMLEGTDWKGIEAIAKGETNFYCYRFPKRSGQSVWVAWWDWYEEMHAGPERPRTFELPLPDGPYRATEAIMDRDGSVRADELVATDGRVALPLRDSPVFVQPDAENAFNKTTTTRCYSSSLRSSE